MTRLDEIPTAFGPPLDACPSDVVARIRAIRPSRRAVLRGLVIGAAATALVPLDWYLTRREASAQAESADSSEHMSCTPESYAEEANNWPAGGKAVCYGGYRRGSYPCSDGYHREGTYASESETYDSTRLTTNCHGKNAWRWNGWRCSDAITLVTFADGTEYNGVTIAACDISDGSLPAAGDESPAPRRGTPPDSGRDPSRPRRPLPDLGLGLRALPGIGSVTGA
jgi:hypothetical protein